MENVYDNKLFRARCLAVLLLLLLLATVTALILDGTALPSSQYPIQAESGEYIPSIFHDRESQIAAAQGVRLENTQPNQRASSRCAATEPTLLDRLTSSFGISAVHAAECWPGSCGGSYMTTMGRECGYDCGWGVYYFHYSNSQIADWWDGWKYNGQTECNGCRCEEESYSLPM